MKTAVKFIGGQVISIILFDGAEVLYHSTPGYGGSSYGGRSDRVSYMDHYGRSAFLPLPLSSQYDGVTYEYDFLQQSGIRTVFPIVWLSKCYLVRSLWPPDPIVSKVATYIL